ncbi:MAG: glycosyltransferase [Halobacteriales archaeon]|nr:glycosyltransferase [Halobacteriales archaeon]
MRILVVSPYLPYPADGGARLRIHHVVQGLAERGHEVTLLAGATHGESLPPDHVFHKLGVHLRSFPAPRNALPDALAAALSSRPYPAHRFRDRRFRGALDAALLERCYDVVWVNHLFLADEMVRHRRGELVVLDEHESQELLLGAVLLHGGLPSRAFALLDLPRLRRFERRALAGLDAVACVSAEESQRMRGLSPALAVWEVPNGVDTTAFRPGPPAAGATILFCANFGVRRNTDAALWFARHVLPRVRAHVPDARFLLVGRDAPPALRAWDGKDGVQLTGAVRDVAPFYREAKVAVLPHTYGTFTKLKAMEALAAGLPIVATPQGAKGLAVGVEHGVLLAEGAQGFADAVLGLLRDPERAAEVGRNGRALAERRYAWPRILDDLDARLRALAEARRGARPAGPAPTAARVAVVIANHEGADCLHGCVESVLASHHPVEVLVVDNASRDGAAEAVARAHPEVALLRNAENAGFAKAMEQGFRWALDRGADYVLPLNSDTQVDPAMVGHLVARARALGDRAVVVPAMLQFRDADRLWFVRGDANLWLGIFRNPLHGQLAAGMAPSRAPMDWAVAAALLVPRRVAQEVGSFDPGFFMYSEDLDWSLRVRRAGFDIVPEPDARVWHWVSAASDRMPAMRRYHMTRNHVWVMRRHAARAQRATFHALLPLRSTVRVLRALAARHPAEAVAEIRGVRDGILLPVPPAPGPLAPAAPLAAPRVAASLPQEGTP